MATYEKWLTATDVTSKLSVPSGYLGRCFPQIDRERGEQFRHFVAYDYENEARGWNFRLAVRREGYLKPVITGEWLAFVQEKDLRVGDTVIFFRETYVDAATGLDIIRYKIRAVKQTRNFLVLLP